LKECREEEDADKCEVTEWSDGMTLHRRLEAYVEADYEHYDALGYGGPEEGLSATERVGGEEEEGGAGYHFNTAVDSSSEETCICALFTVSSNSVCGCGIGKRRNKKYMIFFKRTERNCWILSL